MGADIQGGASITLIISNTALIQMIHHGGAVQMKPVIYHLVERLRDGFLNCGARTVNETGSCWGKSANMDYANKKINPFSNNCVKTQVCKDAKWQKTHMNRGLYESAQATMSHIVVEQQKSRAKFSARLRLTHFVVS